MGENTEVKVNYETYRNSLISTNNWPFNHKNTRRKSKLSQMNTTVQVLDGPYNYNYY